MTRILIGTAAMLICSAAMIDGGAWWLLGVAGGFAAVCKGIKILRNQD